MARLRNAQPILQRGEVTVEWRGVGCVSIFRHYNGKTCCATVNVGDAVCVDKKGKIVLCRNAAIGKEDILLESFGFLCELL
jgi:hypothetical protein